ncbi:MAG: GntR family transcriptional regulator [Lachnospiraceae bacterium]|nr:GntR family transcriptional regulator [Lachnospiraceae bacterium]
MIIIDYKDRRPIYEQIIERFQDLIVKGILKPDSQLPSVRNLAMELSINPNTIQRAYAELERQGYIYSIKGRGSFVSFNEELLILKKKEVLEEIEKAAELAKNFQITEEEVIGCVKQVYGGEEEK